MSSCLNIVTADTALISFIIIGKNEGFKLELCIKSVFGFVVANGILDYEVIYVDSRSDDGSVEKLIKKGYPMKIIVLTGDCNAAIGRNAGAAIAEGDILFFIDGDMELNPGFEFQKLLEMKRECFLYSGQIQNIFYTPDFKTETARSDYYPGLDRDRTEIYFGGIFIIERNLWNDFEGMRTRFVYGEDLDLSMRLSAQGFRLVRVKEILAFHHTTKKRLTFMQLIKNSCYSRGYLYRKHLGNKFLINRILRSDPTVPVLIISVSAALVFKDVSFTLGYFLITLAAVFVKHRKSEGFAGRFFQQLIRDIFVILSALFYYPGRKKAASKLVYEKSPDRHHRS